METRLIFLLLCLQQSFSLGVGIDYSGHKVITAIPHTEDHITILKEFKDNNQIKFWQERIGVGVPVMIQLARNAVENVEKRLYLTGIPFTVAFEDLQRAIEKERVANYYSKKRTLSNESNTDFDFGSYHPLKEIYDYIKNVEETYSDLATVIKFGESYEGRDMLALKLSAPANQSKLAVVLEFGMHAREWVSPATSLYIINQIVNNHQGNLDEILETYDFYIIPVMNPDGYVVTHKYDRLWRKTRSRRSSRNCIGVDPNRNFDSHHCGVGSTKRPCRNNYCGPRPFSENETAALRDFIMERRQQIKLYFAIHAFAQYWTMPYGYSEGYPDNYEELMKFAEIGVKAIEDVHGKSFQYGSISEIIYPAAGNSIDWVYDACNVSLAYALELRDTGRYGFLLPKEQIIPAAEETWAGITAVINASLTT